MSTNKKFILLVDDDEDDRVFFQEALDDLNCSVNFKSVEHGLAAIELLEDRDLVNPDAIFLDLNMPVMDGHDCLKEIRSNKNFDNIKVIIFSTSYNPEVAKVLKDDGANYYIQKPSDYLSLRDTINNALSVVYETVNNTNIFLITTE